MTKYILLAATALAFSSVIAQTNLQPAEVEAFRLKSPEKLVTGVVYTIDSAVIRSHGSSDISRALNCIPGVKMDTRGEGGSRRIQIRGSSLRSPYSVRNSMMLIDGFVFTEADGNSPIEWLDPEVVSQISVVTGPAASSYGGAYGGAIIAESSNPSLVGNYSTSQARIASTGRIDPYSNFNPSLRLFNPLKLQYRIAYTTQYNSDDFSYTLSIISAENPGYRDWEWNIKDQLYFNAKSVDEKGGQHNLIAGLYMGSWALPGAINDSISTVSPLTSPGLNYNAHVNRDRFIGGYGYEKTTSSNIELKASVLGRYTTKVNPYGTSNNYKGYKEENGMGVSLLASALKTKNLNDSWDLQAELSLMHLRDNNNLAEWESAPSSLTVVVPMRYELAFDADQTFASTSLILTNNENLRFEAQIGVNHRNRLTEGIVFIEDSLSVLQPEDYNVDKNPTTFLPRIGFSYMPTESISLFGQFSTGFSDPTAFELVDNETLLPAELDSENSVGQEIGVRIYLDNNFKLKATAYNQKVNNAIMHITQDNDAIAFENVDGGLLMKGVECEASWNNYLLSFRGFATFTNHTFGQETDYPNHTIPGVPSFTGGLQSALSLEYVKFYGDIRHVGATELLNSNEVLTDPYTILDISTECTVMGNYFIEIGCRNVLNSAYSNWPQINGGWGKLYNPAPPRTIFASVRRPI